MPLIQIELSELREIIRESVREAIRNERFLFYESQIPEVSDIEMKDIEAEYASKPGEHEFQDLSSWLNDESRV
jgi:hypothetical protein